VVRVRAQEHRGIVPEPGRYVMDALALVEEQRRMTVPQRVQGHGRQAGAAHELPERARHIRRITRPAVRPGEHEAVVLRPRARDVRHGRGP
jgi:hypothetical protein